MLQLNLKNTFVYTILGFLPLSFSIIFTPIYTQYLSKEDYGLLNLFNIINGLLIPFFGFGIDQSSGFLYWDYSSDKKKLSEFMSTTIILIFLLGSIIFLFGFIFGPFLINTFVNNGSKFTLWPFLTLALLYPFFMITNRVLLYYYRNEGNIKKYATLNLSALILITMGSVMGVIMLNKGSAGAVEGRTIGFCAIVLLFLIREIRSIGLILNRTIAKSLIKLGGPLFFSTLVGSLAYIGDRVIVEELGSLEMLGVYGFSVVVASVIEILLAALSNSFVPAIYKIILNEDEKEYENIKSQLFVFVYLIIAAAMFLIAIIAPFITMFISHNFVESIQYIPLLCLSFIPRCFTQIFSLKFYKKKTTTYILFLNIIYLVSIFILGIIFYKYFDLKGIVLSVFITGVINMTLSYFLSQRLDPFNFNFKKLYILFALISISVVLLDFAPQTLKFRSVFYIIPFAIFTIVSILFLRKECIEIKNYIFLALKNIKKY